MIIHITKPYRTNEQFEKRSSQFTRMTTSVLEEINDIPHLVQKSLWMRTDFQFWVDAVSMLYPPLLLNRTIKSGQMTESSY